MGNIKGFLTFWRSFWVVVALLIWLLAWQVVSAALTRPVISVDYAAELTTLAREYQPGWEAQPNRREEFIDLVREAANALEDVSTHGAADVMGLIEEPPPEDEGLLAIDRRYMEVLERDGFFDRTSVLPEIRHSVLQLPLGVSLFEWIMVSPAAFGHLGSMQQLGKVLTVRAVLDARAGEIERSLEMFEQAFALARLTSCEPFLISGLVGIALENSTATHAMGIIANHRYSSEELDRLARIAADNRCVGYDYSLRCERMNMYDMIQNTFSDNGKGSGFFLLSEGVQVLGDFPVETKLAGSRVFNIIGKFMLSRQATTEIVDKSYNRMIAIAKDPTSDWLTFIRSEGDLMMEIQNYPLLAVMMPAVGSSVQNSISMHTTRSALDIVIALEHHYIEMGAYPESLDALVPNILPALPIDHLAADGLFVYAQSEDGDSSYSLYSVGHNGNDDGGTDNDLVFIP